MPCGLCGDIIPAEVTRCPGCGAWARRRDFRTLGIGVFMLLGFNAFMALGIASYGYVLQTGRVVLEGPGPELLQNERTINAYLG